VRSVLVAAHVPPCPFIAPECILDRTGSLPPDLFAASSYAFYCSGVLCTLRLILKNQERSGGKESGEEDVRVAVEKLETAVREGRPLVKRLGPEFTSLRVAAPFDFPGTQSASAHLAALDLATRAVACIDRPDRVHEVGLDETDYCRLEREITWEACRLAAIRKDTPKPEYLPQATSEEQLRRVANADEFFTSSASPARNVPPAAPLVNHANDRVVIVEDESDERYLRLWMEKVLLQETFERFSTGMICLHTGGRPTPDVVNQRLDTIRRLHPGETNLQPRAFVVADRDYRLEEELQAERAKLSTKPFQHQSWYVWKRSEIENYFVCPRAIVRLVVGPVAAAPPDPRFPVPKEEEVLAAIEEAVEASREAARNQLVNTFARLKKSLAPSSWVVEAENFLGNVWRGEDRLSWCDAKEVVLPRLREQCKRRWNVALSEVELVLALRADEVPADIIQAVEALSAFLSESPWLTIRAGDREAARALAEALKNSNAEIRRTAAEALAERGRAALPLLVKALKDNDAEVRRAAARSLAGIGPQAGPAAPALAAALSDSDPEVRRRSASALGAIGPTAQVAVPALLGRLANDEDACTRWTSAGALSRRTKVL
jgi:hypothetical protein